MTSANGSAPPRPRDYRHHCGRLLFRGRIPEGTYIEVRCPKCGQMHTLEVQPNGTAVLVIIEGQNHEHESIF
jgi:phage FluMu protein Com